MGGAEAVAVLRDFEGGPVVLRQRGDDASNDRGLANVARVSTDDDNGHG
jgi:hypothetical protein